MNILLATDSFPPNCGGSGWSTYELARGLQERGHSILILRVTAGRGQPPAEPEPGGFRVIRFHAYAPNLPGVRNYFKNERLYPKLARRIEEVIATERIDVVHGQHVLSGPPSVQAARRQRIPSVITVRDYWPVCFRSDLMHTPDGLALCPGCARAAGVQHGRAQIGLAGFGRLVARQYLGANMALKRQALLDADAVIAVSTTIAVDLVDRAPELARARIEVIPNPVDVRALAHRAAAARPMADPYALYVGKLAPNKGTDHLVGVIEQADLDWPLVIAGDGPDRRALEAAARSSGRDVRFLGWIDQEGIVAWLAHAAMLIFPSRGPESLSRVLLEASALGVPIAAMHTGGTGDIVEDEITGLLSTSPSELADDVRRIRHGEVLRRRLGAAAARRASERFDTASVSARVEALYQALISEREP
jgi:glycosyltransferase involved in cell wall biosynthesis